MGDVGQPWTAGPQLAERHVPGPGAAEFIDEAAHRGTDLLMGAAGVDPAVLGLPRDPLDLVDRLVLGSSQQPPRRRPPPALPVSPLPGGFYLHPHLRLWQDDPVAPFDENGSRVRRARPRPAGQPAPRGRPGEGAWERP